MIREIAISAAIGALFRREFAALLRLRPQIAEAPESAWPLERPFAPGAISRQGGSFNQSVQYHIILFNKH